MDQRIVDLKSTTFSDRRLTQQQIADIQNTITLFPNDCRNELMKTICEHLGATTAKGDYKVGASLGMLETLESWGYHVWIFFSPTQWRESLFTGGNGGKAGLEDGDGMDVVKAGIQKSQLTLLLRVIYAFCNWC